MDKLYIYYVESPNDSLGRDYLLKNVEIAESDTCSYCGDFWTSFNMENARALVRGLFGTPENGGDPALQHYAKEICQILDAPVEVWLYNDIDAINALAKKIYNPCTDADGYVWPCASTLDKDNNEYDEWAGYMHMGAINMNAHEEEWTKATFLHELMHTQDRSDIRAHIYYSYTAGKWYKYGSDGEHADYLTGYNAKDKQEFSEIFEEELPQPWIDLYWDTAMKDVRNIVPLDDNTSYDDLESVARALDIYSERTP